LQFFKNGNISKITALNYCKYEVSEMVINPIKETLRYTKETFKRIYEDYHSRGTIINPYHGRRSSRNVAGALCKVINLGVALKPLFQGKIAQNIQKLIPIIR
jgi:hypothetical protein